MYRVISTSKVVEFFKSGTAVVKEHYNANKIRSNYKSCKSAKMTADTKLKYIRVGLHLSSFQRTFVILSPVRHSVYRLFVCLSVCCLSLTLRYVTHCSARNWVYHPYFVLYNNLDQLTKELYPPTLKTWLRLCPSQPVDRQTRRQLDGW